MKKVYFSPILLMDINPGEGGTTYKESQNETPGEDQQKVQNLFAPQNLVDEWFPEESNTLE